MQHHLKHKSDSSQNYFKFNALQTIVRMKTTLILSILLVSCWGLHLERGAQQHNRKISSQCCSHKGGFECGTIVKECCELPEGVTQEEAQKSPGDHCKNQGILGTTQNCPGKQITEDCEYCTKWCESQGGKLCGWQNAGQEQCCTEQDCTGDVNLKFNLQQCKKGTTFDIKGCIHDLDATDGVIESIAGLMGIQETQKDDEKSEKGEESEK